MQGGYAVQTASMAPENNGLDVQMKAVQMNEGGGGGGGGGQQLRKANTSWGSQMAAFFGDFDKDGDGYLSRADLNASMEMRGISQYAAAAVATTHRYIEDIEEASDDEIGDENDGVTHLDILATEDGKGDVTIADVESSYWEMAEVVGNQSWELFPNGTPSLDALDQGLIGDCYFLAAVGAIINRDPGELTNLIFETTDGEEVVSYTVTFPGVDESVVVDPPGPGEIARYSSSVTDGLWLPVLEKAYMKLVSGQDDGNRDSEIGDGDYLSAGMDPFVGATDTDDLAVTYQDTTRAKLTAAFENKRLVTAAILTDNDLGLPSLHAYTIIAWDAEADKLTIRNPWGYNPEGVIGEEDGVFELSLEVFDDVFFQITYEE